MCTSLANMLCEPGVDAELGNVPVTGGWVQCSLTGTCKTAQLGVPRWHAVQAGEKVHLPGLRSNVPLIKWKQPTSLLSRNHKQRWQGQSPLLARPWYQFRLDLSPQGPQRCRCYLKLPTWMDREASGLWGRPGVSALERRPLLCM